MSNSRRFLPSLSNLSVSLRLRSKEFIRENTLHGFLYFVNPRRPLWERIAWFVCTMSSIGAALGIIVTIMNNFLHDPLLMGLHTETEDLVTHFPIISLCKVDPEFNLDRYQPDAEYYKSMYNWSWKPLNDSLIVDVSGQSYSEIFYHAAPNCEDLYDDCRMKSISCKDMFRKIITTRGVCCVIEAKEIGRDTKLGGASFRSNAYPISLIADISVDLLEKNGLPPERQSPPSYYLTTGVTIKITVLFTFSTTGLEALSMYSRRCLLPAEALSYNNCIYQCQKNRILNVCGCVPWFLVPVGKDRECTRKDYDCLIVNKDILTTNNCECYLSCNHTSYKFNHLEYSESNETEITILNWPSVLYKIDVKYGWLDLLVSFGGIAGLFVGYSLLTTVELCYYFSLRCYCGAVLTESDKTIKINVLEGPVTKRRVIKVIDLKKDYYDYVN